MVSTAVGTSERIGANEFGQILCFCAYMKHCTETLSEQYELNKELCAT